MAAKCANCGSADVQAEADVYVCLTCGASTDYHGQLRRKPAG